jgi:acetyl esterase/lipase
MKIRFGIFFIVFFLLSGLTVAQEKKRISTEDYAGWKRLGAQALSPEGDWLQYIISPQHEGDAELFFENLENGQTYSIPRGLRPSISPGNGFAVFNIVPEASVMRQARVDGLRPNQMPTDSLGIFHFNTGEVEKLPGIISTAMPEVGSDWLVYLIDYGRVRRGEERAKKAEAEERKRMEKEVKPEPEPEPEPEREQEPEQEPEDEPEEAEKEELPSNRRLYIYNPVTAERFVIEDVKEYLFSNDGNMVAAITEKEENDSIKMMHLNIFDIKKKEMRIVDSREGDMRRLVMNKGATHMSWLFTADTTDIKIYDIYLWEARRDRITRIVDRETEGIPEGTTVSPQRSPMFAENGERVFFSLRPMPEEQAKDTLLSSEKYSLDVWHWQDPVIQPQQLNTVSSDRNRTWMAVYHRREQKVVQLTHDDMSGLTLGADRNFLTALGSTSDPYIIESTYMGGSRRDFYLIDVKTGRRKLVLEGLMASVSMSPEGKYLFWYDRDDKHYKTYCIEREQIFVPTIGVDVAWFNEQHDQPVEPGPYGSFGWTKGDKSLLIYDRYDLWEVDPLAKRPPLNLTQAYGRENKLTFRLLNLNNEENYIDLSTELMLEAFQEETMQSGYYSLQNGQLEKRILEDAQIYHLAKAKNAGRYLFRRGTFDEYTDVWVSGPDFSEARKMTETNPRMSDYYWGSVQLVEWQDFDNQTLRGLLYVPEDLDPDSTYPMIVYFYELSSQNLYRHRMPAPSSSTINIPHCTSNGYIVFVPDITYKTGFPGEGAYNAIISGTKAMVERYPFINRERMALQGQSWGGYQIAYLITRTNMFRAAMAGAPVSNMISAYGGIRWESGRSRQFQYELTQSRIGGTLWEKPLRYIENSPVFYADKIETPLLMMHNDNDGAVPWYQGIEMFMAMRRLEKPVWMLVYNDEGHNLSKWPNRMDLSIRMYQFFDHYLKDKPAPAWLEKGIPAVDKGRVDGYELMER